MSESIYIIHFIHPILMLLLLGLSCYSMFLGLKVMQTRMADIEIRKQLIKERFDIRHFQIGRLILALMVLGSLVGIVVHSLSDDELIISHHLPVGISMIFLVFLSVAIIPLIQQGNLFARRAHVTLNIIMMALFLWQVASGMQLVNEIKESHLI